MRDDALMIGKSNSLSAIPAGVPRKQSPSPPGRSTPNNSGSGRFLSIAGEPEEWEVTLPVADCARRILQEHDEFRRLQMFYRLLARMAGGDGYPLELLFREFAALDRKFPTEYKYFMRRWGEVDGPSLMEVAPQVFHGPWSLGNLGIPAGGWARQDPRGLSNWINGHPDVEQWMRSALLTGLVDGLAERDLTQAKLLVERSRDNPNYPGMLLELTDKILDNSGVEQAKEWYSTLPDDTPPNRHKVSVLHQLVQRISDTDTEGAANFLLTQEGRPGFDIVMPFVAQRFVAADSKRAAEWAAKLAVEGVARAAMQQALEDEHNSEK